MEDSTKKVRDGRYESSIQSKSFWRVKEMTAQRELVRQGR